MAFDGLYVSDYLVKYTSYWATLFDTFQKQWEGGSQKVLTEILSYSGTCFIGGLIMDHYGTRALRLISNILLTGGSLVLAFSDPSGR